MGGVSEPTPEPTGKAARYQRSTGALVGSMIVTVVVVVLVVVLRGCISADLEVTPESVDYRESVSQAQGAGIEVVYPPALPEGWIATQVEVEPGDPPGFSLNMLTGDQQFVGVRQSSEDDVDDLLDELVDESADEEGTYEAQASVAPTWEVYTDDGGDRAYATTLGDYSLLVYGPADAAALEGLVESLTTAPVTP